MSFSMISRYADENIVFNHTRYEVPCDNDFPFHTHDLCEFIFLADGDVSGIIGAKAYKLHKGSLIIFRSPLIHRIRIDTPSPYERYNIIFDENTIASEAFKRIPDAISVIDFSENHYISDLFFKMDYYTKHFSDGDLKTLINSLLKEIVLNMTLASPKTVPVEYSTANALLNSAIEYIDENFSYAITVEDVSNHLYISKRHLHHLFLKHFQISPKKYINSKRLAMAQKLIRMGQKPYNIYHSCGFGDYATFYRNFKAAAGYPPSSETGTELKREIKS